MCERIGRKREEETVESFCCRDRSGEDGAIAVLREGGAEEGAVDAGGGPEAARAHRPARPRLLALAARQGRSVISSPSVPPWMQLALFGRVIDRGAISCVCVCMFRSAALRQELPAPVDQLPAAGHQEGQVHPPGGADHHPAPRATRQQVTDPFHGSILHVINLQFCFLSLPLSPLEAQSRRA